MRLLSFVAIVLFSHMTVTACELELNSADRSQADKTRDLISLPCRMSALLPVKPGNVVLDLLGGNGYFSELLSQQVGANGKVYLHNNQAYLPYVEKQLLQRLEQNRLPNVIRLDAELDKLPLAPDSLDVVYFIMGYHDMYHVSEGWKIDPQQMMTQIYTALKPGGKMLIVDHNASAGSGTTAAQELHRIEASYVQQEIQKFGFKLITSSDALANDKDDFTKSVFDKTVRGKTDRFVLVLQKPANL